MFEIIGSTSCWMPKQAVGLLAIALTLDVCFYDVCMLLCHDLLYLFKDDVRWFLLTTLANQIAPRGQ